MGIVLQNAVDFIARYGRFMQRPSLLSETLIVIVCIFRCGGMVSLVLVLSHSSLR